MKNNDLPQKENITGKALTYIIKKNIISISTFCILTLFCIYHSNNLNSWKTINPYLAIVFALVLIFQLLFLNKEEKLSRDRNNIEDAYESLTKMHGNFNKELKSHYDSLINHYKELHKSQNSTINDLYKNISSENSITGDNSTKPFTKLE